MNKKAFFCCCCCCRRGTRTIHISIRMHVPFAMVCFRQFLCLFIFSRTPSTCSLHTMFFFYSSFVRFVSISNDVCKIVACGSVIPLHTSIECVSVFFLYHVQLSLKNVRYGIGAGFISLLLLFFFLVTNVK